MTNSRFVDVRVACLAVFTLCVSLMTGCGSGSGSNSTSSASPTITINSPSSGSTLTSLPVTLSVSFSNGAVPTQMTALLDGVDITADFAAAVNGVRTATVTQPAVNYGENQLQIRYQQQTINSSFIVNTAGSGTPSPAPGSPASVSTTLVPIQTRVLKANSDPSVPTNWGVQVGSTTYWANPPSENNGGNSTPCETGTTQCSTGYQILLLSRHDLSVVANVSYSTDVANDVAQDSPFVFYLGGLDNSVSGCAPAGCVLVMQSLEYMGYASCYTQAPYCPDSFGFILAMQALGATGSTSYVNGTLSNVAYSFIGNVGGTTMPPNIGGTQYERLGCSLTTACDNVGNFRSVGNSVGEVPGSISGALVRDNYNCFTYAPSAPQIYYTFGTTTNSNNALTNVISFNGSASGDVDYYSQSLPQTVAGGFHLLVLNRTDPTGPNAKVFEGFFDASQISQLNLLITTIQSYQTANSLFFLASIGKVSHDDTNPTTAPVWNNLANAVSLIGGDPLTFKLFGDVHFDPTGVDDYLLVGRPVNNGTITMPPYYGSEAGMVIAKKTVTNATGPTNLEGILALDHYGYYIPRAQGQNVGLTQPQTAAILNASLLAPVAWPYSSDSGHMAAYTYLSNQLCCSDIRSAYVNLNASPEVWLTQIYQINYPGDGQGFTEDDFDDVQGQLETEFQYLSLVRNLQTNILSLYQSQQSNVALILQQAEDDVVADVYNSTPPPQPPSAWQEFTQDIFPTMANLAGFAPGGNYVKTSLGVGILVVDSTIERTNNANGQSQLMQRLAAQNVAASELAQSAVDQYTDSLISLGNDFDRVVTDWGRLKAIGGPLASGELQWDDTASGDFLLGFNLTARRIYYQALMVNSNFFIAHDVYANPDYVPNDSLYVQAGTSSSGCGLDLIQQGQQNNNPTYAGTAWYPGVLQAAQSPDGTKTPNAYWWDVWALGASGETTAQCPDGNVSQLPSSFGMFDAIDPNNTSALGIWKPYFFERSGIKTYTEDNGYYDNGYEP